MSNSLDLTEFVCLDRSLAIYRLSQRVHHAAGHRIADRNFHHAAGRLNGIALADVSGTE